MQRLRRRKWLMVCTLFFVGVLPLFLGGCGSNQSSSNPPVWNITGGWYTFYATKDTAGEQGPNLFTLTVTNNNIAGFTSKSQPITGQIAGLDISFSFVDSDGSTNSSTGTVAAADGSTMSGTWTKGTQSGTWHAVINLPPTNGVSVAGNWNMFQTTSGVTGEQALGLFAFTQSVNSIAGTTSDGKSIIGAIGRIDVTFFWIGNDGVTHTFTGIITADSSTMSGTWSDTSGKSGTWRSTKS
jgi:hypothetical protein